MHLNIFIYKSILYTPTHNIKHVLFKRFYDRLLSSAFWLNTFINAFSFTKVLRVQVLLKAFIKASIKRH